MSLILDGSNGITFPNSSTQAVGFYGFKNRIINGAMVIDQRNSGASVTPTASAYTLDRWFASISQSSKFSVQQNAGSVTPPVGFVNYLGVTSLSAYTVGASEFFQITQQIEGLNIGDLGWGTANAKTVTLSFQVYSSLTGTFGGVLANGAFNRSYPFSYSIPLANTWTTISITIAGDTSGTWLTTNGIGIYTMFSLGSGSTVSGTAGSWAGAGYRSATGATSVVGTNGATFYITGVQLEAGSTATSFDYRPYGTELSLCQRYCYAFSGVGGYSAMPFSGFVQANGSVARLITVFPVTMRGAPSLTTPAANSIIIQGPSAINYTPTALALTSNSAQLQSAMVDATVSGQATLGCVVFDNNTSNSKFIFSAEL